jgi:hypothetical protein
MMRKGQAQKVGSGHRGGTGRPPTQSERELMLDPQSPVLPARGHTKATTSRMDAYDPAGQGVIFVWWS